MSKPSTSSSNPNVAPPTDLNRAAPNPTSTKRFQQTQAQVDEVVDIMRMNVDRVLERDAKLSQLDDRADALQMGASQFEQSSGQLKRKMAWKNLKMTIILAVVVGLLLLAIVVWIAVKVKPDTVEILPYFTKPVETTLKTTTEAVPDVTNK